MVILINPDKTISIDGKKTFLVFMDDIVTNTWANTTSETPQIALEKNNNALVNWALNTRDYTISTIIPTHNTANIMFMFDIGTSITAEIKDNKGFLGYVQWDEATTGIGRYASMTEIQMLGDLKGKYDNHKLNDPTHPVFFNHWTTASKWEAYCDVMSWDTYSNGNWSWATWTRPDAIYAWEILSNQNYLQGREIPSFSKTFIAVIQSNGVEFPSGLNLYLPTIQEIRATTFCAICLGVQAINFYGYQRPDALLNLNPALTVEVNNLMGELRSLNDDLVSPTLDYQWTMHKGKATFSNQYVKIINYQATTNFSYIVKPNMLIIVNKDSRPITSTVTIPDIRTVTQIERTGVVIPVSNNTFTDNFDGLAVHIYKILSEVCPPSQCNFTITQ